MNYEAVYRTAPATPGLLISYLMADLIFLVADISFLEADISSLVSDITNLVAYISYPVADISLLVADISFLSGPVVTGRLLSRRWWTRAPSGWRGCSW